MNATAWVIIIFYFLTFLGLAITFSSWWLTRKGEDNIWRWIFSLIGVLIFFTFFWINYWVGSAGAWPIVAILMIATYIWLYGVFSTRSESMLDRIVFAAFGSMVLGMTSLGGYTSGQHGWWGMAIVFYGVILHTIYSLIEPH